MEADVLYWTKFAAIAQALGALATFLAVVASLHIARGAGKPKLRITVGERLIKGGGPDRHLLMFEVANKGGWPVHVGSVGWRTGWLPWGPGFLRRKYAVQVTSSTAFGVEPPFAVAPGAKAQTHAPLVDVLAYAEECGGDPLFSRDWPLIGRRVTRVRATVSIATGETIVAKVESSLIAALVEAEKRAIERNA